MSTTESFGAIIGVTAVKPQMSGGEICRVPMKVVGAGHGNRGQE